jgi:hypothetical protein
MKAQIGVITLAVENLEQALGLKPPGVTATEFAGADTHPSQGRGHPAGTSAERRVQPSSHWRDSRRGRRASCQSQGGGRGARHRPTRSPLGHLLRLLPRPRRAPVGNHPQPKQRRCRTRSGYIESKEGLSRDHNRQNSRTRHHNIPSVCRKGPSAAFRCRARRRSNPPPSAPRRRLVTGSTCGVTQVLLSASLKETFSRRFRRLLGALKSSCS